MKTKVSKVILMFVLVMGFGLCLLNGEDHGDHWWKFHETSGTSAHDSIGNVNGTLHGGAKFLQVEDDGCVNIPASEDSYVSFGTNVGQFGKKDFTVSLEFKTNNSTDAYDLVGNRTTTFGNFFQIHISTGFKNVSSVPGGIVVATLEDENKKNLIWLRYENHNYADGQWHTVMVIRTGKTMALYIDNMKEPVMTGTAPDIANIHNDNEFKLGHSTVAPWISPADIVCRNLKICGEHSNSTENPTENQK